MPFKNGNLVQNPGFETGDFSGWNASTNVTIIDTVEAHTGHFIASFSSPNSSLPGILVQDVQISAGQVFALIFHLSGKGLPPIDFRAEVRWLNYNKMDLGQGLAVFVNGRSVGVNTDGEWSPQYRLTGLAPNDAQFARLIFTSGPDDSTDPILLDDVVFAVV